MRYRTLAIVLWVLVSSGAGLRVGGQEPAGDDTFLSELKEAAHPLDLGLVGTSHLSDVRRWAAGGGAKEPAPLTTPRTTTIKVPAAGTYRVWLHFLAVPNAPQSLTLNLTGATTAQHVYGQPRLDDNHTGQEQEEKLPFRFESEADRLGIPRRSTWLWEYWDATLQAGPTTLTLVAAEAAAQADALFLSRSRDFVPSRSPEPFKSTINRTYYRFRVLPGATGAKTCTIGNNLTYHWRFIEKGKTEPTWYSSLEQEGQRILHPKGGPQLPVGEWSAFLDATYASSAPGPWATVVLGFSGIQDGEAEIQLAWGSRPEAVLKTIRPRIRGGQALVLVPLASEAQLGTVAAADDRAGVWGTRPAAFVEAFQTDLDVFQRHQQFAAKALAGVPEGQPLPHLLLFGSDNGASPGARDETTRMLRQLGVNNISGASAALVKELGLRDELWFANQEGLYTGGTHCPTDPGIQKYVQASMAATAQALARGDPDAPAKVRRIKLGDEIGAIAGAAHVNRCSDCLAFFHEFLRRELAAAGREPSFFGVDRLEDLRLLDDLPPAAGQAERRLYYHSVRFRFALTAEFYRHLTKACEAVFPGVHTYCNFSPHPPMFGGHMNGADWFALNRQGGTTMAWSEDWAGATGGWSMAGVQTVGYYAALVACAARPQQLPTGFYVVMTMGSADRRVFTLLSEGVFCQWLYTFGPRYAGAEFSNFWDEHEGAYRDIVIATRALGPADRLIAEGQREPARAALLYNRSHELWQAGYGGFQTDRLLTFIALKHAHQPAAIILEDDLSAAALAPYRVLYLQGFNLAERHVQAVRQWVEAGGTLVAIAGTAQRDEYDEPNAAAAALFGARQQVTGVSTGGWHALALPEHQPIDTLKLQESPLTPALDLEVIGVKCVLTPTTGRAVGTYRDGTCSAVLNDVGKGHVLLLGVMPGLLYKGRAAGSNKYQLDRLDLIAKPARVAAGPGRVEYSEPLVEATLFEHEQGLAVTLMDATWQPGRAAVLKVTTPRPIKTVVSTVRGPLAWQREGDRIVVQCPVPESVDVVILKE